MITVQALLFIVAVVLMAIAAFGFGARVSLATLAWAFAILAFALPVIDAAL